MVEPAHPRRDEFHREFDKLSKDARGELFVELYGRMAGDITREEYVGFWRRAAMRLHTALVVE